MEVKKIHNPNNDELVKQSPEPLPRIPFRTLVLAPSGSGKTNLLIWLLNTHWKHVFKRILIVSHSVNIDPSWQSVDIPSANVVYMDKFDGARIQKEIDIHLAVREKLKKNKERDSFGEMLILMDDVIDGGEVSSNKLASLMTTLAIRSRHFHVSVVLSSQKHRLAVPFVLRINLSHYIIFALQNQLELDSVMEEFGIVVSKKEFKDMYDIATSKKYGFLFIHKNPVQFWSSFSKKLL